MTDPASKVRPISGDNAKAAFTRLLQLAGAPQPNAPGAQPLPSPELRQFALRFLKAITSEGTKAEQIRRDVRTIVDAAQDLFALVNEQEGAPKP